MDYQNKDTAYYSNVRHDLLGLIGKNKTGLKVLEIGAAYGETLYWLKQQRIAAEAVGVDIFQDTKNQSRYKEIDRFIFGDIHLLDFPEYEGYFDLILLPDVLEHLVEPTKVLDKVKYFLKPSGDVLVSMPNIRHYSAFVRIFIKGDFRYEPSGIFDYTHMRFYCRKNMRELLEKQGFSIQTQVSAIRNYKGKSAAKVINAITLNLFEEILSAQYFFKAKIQA